MSSYPDVISPASPAYTLTLDKANLLVNGCADEIMEIGPLLYVCDGLQHIAVYTRCNDGGRQFRRRYPEFVGTEVWTNVLIRRHDTGWLRFPPSENVSSCACVVA